MTREWSGDRCFKTITGAQISGVRRSVCVIIQERESDFVCACVCVFVCHTRSYQELHGRKQDDTNHSVYFQHVIIDVYL